MLNMVDDEFGKYLPSPTINDHEGELGSGCLCSSYWQLHMQEVHSIFLLVPRKVLVRANYN